MTTYRYEGLSANGAKIDGIVEAVDKNEALAKAKASCRVVLKVEAQAEKNLFTADIGDMIRGSKVRDKELSLLCSQLAIELKAGLPLVRSLELVAENEANPTLKTILIKTAEDVSAGHGLAESFVRNGPQLPATFVETVKAGEDSGALDDSFVKLKDYYKNSSKVAAKVGSALLYPTMLIVVAVIVVGIIMIKAVPVFEKSFASMGNELPGLTKALIAVSHFMTRYYLLFIALIAGIALAVKLYGQTEQGKALYAKIALTFPGIGKVNEMNAASQFASTMGTMLASGLPMVQAAQITSRVVSNYLIQQDIYNAANGVITGRRLGDGLKESKWLPKLLLEMTAVGEETGNLEDTLQVINDYYNDEVNVAVDRALSILEPVIVAAMAFIVVLILLSVYLPLFSMYGTV